MPSTRAMPLANSPALRRRRRGRRPPGSVSGLLDVEELLGPASTISTPSPGRRRRPRSASPARGRCRVDGVDGVPPAIGQSRPRWSRSLSARRSTGARGSARAAAGAKAATAATAAAPRSRRPSALSFAAVAHEMIAALATAVKVRVRRGTRIIYLQRYSDPAPVAGELARRRKRLKALQ